MRRWYSHEMEEFRLYFYLGNEEEFDICFIYFKFYLWKKINKFLCCANLCLSILCDQWCVVCVDEIFLLREERSILVYA